MVQTVFLSKSPKDYPEYSICFYFCPFLYNLNPMATHFIGNIIRLNCSNEGITTVLSVKQFAFLLK